jgi:hypothetical protein
MKFSASVPKELMRWIRPRVASTDAEYKKALHNLARTDGDIDEDGFVHWKTDSARIAFSIYRTNWWFVRAVTWQKPPHAAQDDFWGVLLEAITKNSSNSAFISNSPNRAIANFLMMASMVCPDPGAKPWVMGTAARGKSIRIINAATKNIKTEIKKLRRPLKLFDLLTQHTKGILVPTHVGGISVNAALDSLIAAYKAESGMYTMARPANLATYATRQLQPICESALGQMETKVVRALVQLLYPGEKYPRRSSQVTAVTRNL